MMYANVGGQRRIGTDRHPTNHIEGLRDTRRDILFYLGPNQTTSPMFSARHSYLVFKDHFVKFSFTFGTDRVPCKFFRYATANFFTDLARGDHPNPS